MIRRLQDVVRIAFVMLFFGTLQITQATAQDALSPAQKDAVRDLVRETLIENPDVLMDALIALQNREDAQSADRAREAIAKIHHDISRPGALTPMGNESGNVTIIEFSDYNCGYCKQAALTVRDLMKADGKIKYYVMELPILGPDSIAAARVALAARQQDRYEDLYWAAMTHRGRLSEQGLLDLAKAQGLDIDRLKKDAQAPEIEELLRKSFQAAETLGVRGTPAFIVGDRFVGGAPTVDQLKSMISDARKK